MFEYAMEQNLYLIRLWKNQNTPYLQHKEYSTDSEDAIDDYDDAP